MKQTKTTVPTARPKIKNARGCLANRALRRCVFASVFFALTTPNNAQAAGLQLPTRGVRPSARAGAFVAGADDLGAMWFNPSGLAELAGGEQSLALLLDAAYVRQSVAYTRIDSGRNRQAEVRSEAPGLPVPTLAVAFDLGAHFVLGAALIAPYGGGSRFSADGPARYSLVDSSKSLLEIAELALAWAPNKYFRVGLGVQNMIFHLDSTIVVAGCPGQTVCAPEDPSFDSKLQVKQNTLFSPSAVLGLQYLPSTEWRFGAAVQAPFYIGGQGRLRAQLPSSAFYDGATLIGDQADVQFVLPPIVRAGVEYRPNDKLRLELAGSIEFWSMHDVMKIVPKGVRIEGTPGVDQFEFGALSITRNYRDAFAVHLGGEWAPISQPLHILFGYGFESSAAPPAYVSALNVDGAKHLFTTGATYAFGHWQLQALLGYVALASQTITPEVGRAPQITPLRDDIPVYVNWGDYRSHWLLAGLGVSVEL